MKDSIRCCISCILPCGALDVIRIVHASGRVEEISRAVCARDIMQAYPKHVLRKPPSASAFDIDEGPRAAVVLPPSAQLQRGTIYFLMPVSSSTSMTDAQKSRRTRPKKQESRNDSNITANDNNNLLSERYLSEILSETKGSTNREWRRGRVGVWRPRLESIEEIANDV